MCNIGATAPMMSAKGMRKWGIQAYATPEKFENLSTLGCNLVQSEC